MKATGIVRRVDDLGRIVIPREVRRTLNIREGDPLEIFIDDDGCVTFKKFSPLVEEEEDNKKYRLIDDALCDVNPNIDAYENCKDCPYFFDCMEEDLED